MRPYASMRFHTLSYASMRFRFHTPPYASVRFRTLSCAFVYFHTLSYAFIRFIRCWRARACVCVCSFFVLLCHVMHLACSWQFIVYLSIIWYLHNAFGGTNKTVNRFWCIFFDPAVTNDPALRVYIKTFILSIWIRSNFRRAEFACCWNRAIDNVDAFEEYSKEHLRSNFSAISGDSFGKNMLQVTSDLLSHCCEIAAGWHLE